MPIFKTILPRGSIQFLSRGHVGVQMSKNIEVALAHENCLMSMVVYHNLLIATLKRSYYYDVHHLLI